MLPVTQDSKSVTNSAHASTDKKTINSSPSAKSLKRSHGDLEGGQRAHDDDDNDTIHVATDLRNRDHKRSRPVERPLKSGESTNARKENQTGRRNAPTKSPLSRRRLNVKSNRPSRFIEGSMQDRTSAKPPSLYTGDESDYERHAKRAKEGDTGGQADMLRGYGDRQWYDAGIEPSRPSGMFKFGKAIANAFNPIWHGIHGIWKDNKDEEAPPAETVLQKRHIKAEKAYAELKKAGYKGTKGVANGDMPTVKYEETVEVSPSAPNRDSGVDVDERSSAKRKRDGRVFDTDETLMPPPPISGLGPSASPMSDAPLSRKSSLQVRKPSFQSLKKVRSHIQLPSAKKTPGPVTPTPPSTVRKDTGSQTLKKQPSKKELRLSKKVSDLETKLEDARRQLRLAKGNAPPVPDLPKKLGLRPFKPGALPSLPSGLIVDGHGNEDKSKDAKGELHTTNSTAIISDPAPTTTTQSPTTDQPSKVDASIAALADVLLQSIEASEEPKDEKPTLQKLESKKRKSGRVAGNDKRYKPDSDDDDDFEWTLAKTVTPKKKPGRPRKAMKVEQLMIPGSTAGKELQSESKATKQLPKVSEPDGPAEPAAISPPAPAAFDPAKVDKARLLGMRTEPNPFVPFGKLSDDIINLRKEFPTVTDEQLVQYFTFTSAEAKADSELPAQTTPQNPAPAPAPASTAENPPNSPVNPTPAATNPSPSTPLLSRPRSPSPPKSNPAPKTPKPSHSPPPADQNSTSAETVAKLADDDVVVSVDPTKDASVPPLPKVPLGLDMPNGVFEKSLPTMSIAKEEWEWPDDCF